MLTRWAAEWMRSDGLAHERSHVQPTLCLTPSPPWNLQPRTFHQEPPKSCSSYLTWINPSRLNYSLSHTSAHATARRYLCQALVCMGRCHHDANSQLGTARFVTPPLHPSVPVRGLTHIPHSRSSIPRPDSDLLPNSRPSLPRRPSKGNGDLRQLSAPSAALAPSPLCPFQVPAGHLVGQALHKTRDPDPVSVLFATPHLTACRHPTPRHRACSHGVISICHPA